MGFRQDNFVIVQNDLAKAIDVDDSAGRSVPINMNFVEEGYLTKDTGVALFGVETSTQSHSLFHYKKKDGTSHFLRGMGTKLQKYNATTGVWDNLTPTFTADKHFGFAVYNDDLWGCNGTEAYFKYDGTTFTEYASAPKGNILEVFEDRMFVSGVTTGTMGALTVYYSDIATPQTFGGTSVLNPLGTDPVMSLKNYYGYLLIFKQNSIWKMSWYYDSITDTYLPKLEIQSNNYGACSRKAVTWVENDIWFFTGREVRAIGFKDQQTGVLGVNTSIISNDIKETLATISTSNYAQVATFYNNRRFYLAVPISSNVADTVFVCHTLYGNAWTKYASRIKSSVYDFASIDGVIYTNKSVAPFGTLKWDETLKADNSVAIASEVFFRQTEDKDFSKYNLYRYLDLMFKTLEGRITLTVKYDAYDLRQTKSKVFYIGQALEDMDATTGEVPFGQKLYGNGFGEDISGAPFEKKRVSMLVKAQTVTLGLANNNLNETFTIAQWALYGAKQPRRLSKPSSIISLS